MHIGGSTKDGFPKSPGEDHIRIQSTWILQFCRIHQLFSREIRLEGYVYLLFTLLILCPLGNTTIPVLFLYCPLPHASPTQANPQA